MNKTCAACGNTHHDEIIRGLCRPCYFRTRRRGELDQFPRTTWAADELLDEWDHLRRSGHTVRQAAARLDITYEALDQALVRAKRRGDPRAIRSGVRLDVTTTRATSPTHTSTGAAA